MQKRKNKSKAEITEDFKKIEEIKKMKELAQKTLVPLFEKYGLTVYQAGNLLEVLKQVSMGKMNQYWSEKPYQELGMAEELTKDGEVKDRELYAEIIDSLSASSVAETMKLFDVMSRVIEMWGHRQVMQVAFKDLPIEEIMKF